MTHIASPVQETGCAENWEERKLLPWRNAHERGSNPDDENPQKIEHNRPRPHPCAPNGGGKAPIVAQWSGCGCDSAPYGVYAKLPNRWIRLGHFDG